MRSYKVLVLGLVCGVVLSACSTNSGNEINYRESVITPTLEVPPDLISRSSDKNLTLPGSKVGTADNTGRFVETGNLNIEARVLPVIDDLKLEGQGDLYWLSVSMPAVKIYPAIKAFWADQGFQLIKDEPVIGIIETEWLGFKAGNDSFFASFMASMRAAESRDQYSTRIVRNADNEAINIFLAHRGQELVIDEESDALGDSRLKQGWQFVPSDPAKEIEMLSRLMVFLGMQDDQLKQELEKLGQFAARTSIEIDEKEEQPFLVVKHGLGQTWNRLIYQMDRLAIKVTDQSQKRNKATLALDVMDLSEKGIDKNEKNSEGKVLLRLENSVNTNATRIDVLDENADVTHSDESKQLLNYLHDQLR